MESLAPELVADLELLDAVVSEIVRERSGPEALALVDRVERDALALRAGRLSGGRAAFGAGVGAIDLDQLELLGSTTTLLLLLFNAAEEQHRIRVLRRRDRLDAPPEGSLAAACAEVRATGVPRRRGARRCSIARS